MKTTKTKAVSKPKKTATQLYSTTTKTKKGKK
jgi:hypothetical protein